MGDGRVNGNELNGLAYTHLVYYYYYSKGHPECL